MSSTSSLSSLSDNSISLPPHKKTEVGNELSNNLSSSESLSSPPDNSLPLPTHKEINVEDELLVPDTTSNTDTKHSMPPDVTNLPLSIVPDMDLPMSSRADGFASLRDFRAEKQAQKDPSSEPVTPTNFSSPRALPFIHDTWTPIFVHTAKCDNCDENKKAVYQRCQECNHQLCKECMIAGKWKDQIHTADLSILVWTSSVIPAKRSKIAGKNGSGSIKKPIIVSSSSPDAGPGNKILAGTSRAKKQSLIERKSNQVSNAHLTALCIDHQENAPMFQEASTKLDVIVQKSAEFGVDSASPMAGIIAITPQPKFIKEAQPSSHESIQIRRQLARQKSGKGGFPQLIDSYDMNMEKMSDGGSPGGKRPKRSRAASYRRGGTCGMLSDAASGSSRGSLQPHNQTAFEKLGANNQVQTNISALESTIVPSPSLDRINATSDVFAPAEYRHNVTTSIGDPPEFSYDKSSPYSTPEALKATSKEDTRLSEASKPSKFALILQQFQKEKIEEKRQNEYKAKLAALDLEFQHEWATDPVLVKIRSEDGDVEALKMFEAAKSMMAMQLGICLEDAEEMNF